MDSDSDIRTALIVLLAISAIQVAIGVWARGSSVAATTLGAVCFLASATWLVRHREP